MYTKYNIVEICSDQIHATIYKSMCSTLQTDSIQRIEPFNAYNVPSCELCPWSHCHLDVCKWQGYCHCRVSPRRSASLQKTYSLWIQSRGMTSQPQYICYLKIRNLMVKSRYSCTFKILKIQHLMKTSP